MITPWLLYGVPMVSFHVPSGRITIQFSGVALPLLGFLGYAPGARHAAATEALTAVYAVLPLVLKLMAASALWRWRRIMEGEMQ